MSEPILRSEDFPEGFRVTSTSKGLRIDCLSEAGKALILDREKLATFGLRFQHDPRTYKKLSER